MTTFEAAILLNEQFANNMTILSIYITLITGYIILAYNAGANLTKAQNIIVGILFIAFTLTMVLLNYIISVEMFKVSLLLKNYEVSNGWSLFGAVIEVSGILAALAFMNNIRKSKFENK
jgi:hypothetical protein